VPKFEKPASVVEFAPSAPTHMTVGVSHGQKYVDSQQALKKQLRPSTSCGAFPGSALPAAANSATFTPTALTSASKLPVNAAAAAGNVPVKLMFAARAPVANASMSDDETVNMLPAGSMIGAETRPATPAVPNRSSTRPTIVDVTLLPWNGQDAPPVHVIGFGPLVCWLTTAGQSGSPLVKPPSITATRTGDAVSGLRP